MFGRVEDLNFISEDIKAILKTYVRVQKNSDKDNYIMDPQHFFFDPTQLEYQDNKYNNFTVAMGAALIAYAITKVDLKLLQLLQDMLVNTSQPQSAQKASYYIKGLQLSLAYLDKNQSLVGFTQEVLSQINYTEDFSKLYYSVFSTDLDKVVSWLLTLKTTDETVVFQNEWQCTPLSLQRIEKQLHLKVKLFKDAKDLQNKDDYDILIWHDENNDYQYPFVIMFPEDMEGLELQYQIKNQLLTKNYQISIYQSQSATNGYLIQCLAQTFPGYEKFKKLVVQYDSPIARFQFINEIEQNHEYFKYFKNLQIYSPQQPSVINEEKNFQESMKIQQRPEISITESSIFNPFNDQDLTLSITQNQQIQNQQPKAQNDNQIQQNKAPQQKYVPKSKIKAKILQ